MTTILDLIRHGEPEGGPMFRGSKDDPLSEQGWQQMQAAIASTDHWDAIVSSPMARCQRFAETLSEQRSIPLHIEHELREIGFGEWEGLTAEQVEEAYGDRLNRFWQDPINFIPPGGEPVPDFYDRVIHSIHHWQDKLSGQKVLVVCHGGVIRMALADVLGIPLEKSFTGFAVPYACRSRIQIDQSEFGLFRSVISHQP
ncbi:MAG: alpha-ribazole phosphatase family protein [Gammaproteobacteria bacterium]|uniref:Phosphoserine phosphatase 1 n=1 Tax=Marinobacter litoralis TaxID=187981 RepID=A0A3M2RBR5_9GAMM|nr:alpha-ribazole phosphatase family protein [Marinobacter litoralis]MBR9872111.1 alpha-ribazole phosphatase family protein [Gammaproteobacteria bacterium]RMJ02742.1 Phosphoserine phosphatase 1 [Marinobacter litoralis]